MTAYVKMIDIWLIFSMSIPFLEVIMHTFVDYMRIEEGNRTTQALLMNKLIVEQFEQSNARFSNKLDL